MTPPAGPEDTATPPAAAPAERAAGPGSFRMHLLDALDEVGR